MIFVDISYFHNDTADAERLLQLHAPNLLYLDFFPENWERHVIKFVNMEGQLRRGKTNFHFFEGRTSKSWVPLKANRFIASLEPDVVLLHGLIFPHQLLALKAMLPSKTKILVQHHAEAPGKGLMRMLQRVANKFVYRYLFAAKELARPWNFDEKVVEVMEGSSVMERKDKALARARLGLREETVFLWVGRLDSNKDPLTAVRAFERYGQAKLYMFYSDGPLQIQSQSVELKGKLERSELAYWYSAADFYVSASHKEGSGYALIEAMSCGCIPIVTAIPSFKKITGNTGFLYERGDVEGLHKILLQTNNVNKEAMSAAVLAQFEKELSFRAIAEGIMNIISSPTPQPAS